MRRLGHAYLGALALFFYLPILVLLVFSFNSSALMAFPLTGFSLDWYGKLFGHAALLWGFLTSTLIAQPVAIGATLLGLFAALALTARTLRWRVAFGVMLAVPFLVPKGVLAVAQVMVISRLGLDRGVWPLMLSEILVALPFTTIILLAVLVRLDRRLEEAARDLGASPWQSFRHVTLPQLRGALGAAYSVAVILSLSDLTLSMFLAGRTTVLSLIVASAFRRELSPELNAMQAVVLALTALIVIVSETIRRRLARRSGRKLAARRAATMVEATA